MGKTFQGDLIGSGKKFAIVVSRFNEFISSRLLNGAIDCFIRHGTKENDIDVFWVPGSFEIAVAAMSAANSGKYDAIVCLGAVIRGETPHFDYVSSESAKGVSQVGLTTGVPAIYGIITTDTIEQAIDRAGARNGNKGTESAIAAIEMANLFTKMEDRKT